MRLISYHEQLPRYAHVAEVRAKNEAALVACRLVVYVLFAIVACNHQTIPALSARPIHPIICARADIRQSLFLNQEYL